LTQTTTETPTASPGSQAIIRELRASLARVVRGNPEAIELLLVGALSGGHVLIEDVPGVGKTTLAKTLARALELDFKRVQFTPDLLPSDILGTHTLNPHDGSLAFQRGPVFTHVLLADEINRASPRTQSALLEAMNEGQVTIDGVTMKLPTPFIVLATQNPVEFQGTFPLPEAQLDRFVLRFALGYPDEGNELGMLADRRQTDPLDAVRPVASGDELRTLTEATRKVHVEDRVAKYIRAVVAWTRNHDDVALGVSPRGTLVLYRACQARALLCGRDHVIPDDAQTLSIPVLSHRMQTTEQARYSGRTTASICTDAINELPVPT
jgi:MoxR-like ATPase